MKAPSFFRKLETQILSPPVLMLVFFTVLGLYVNLVTRKQLSLLQNEIVVNKAVSNYLIQVARIRSRMREALLQYRMTHNEKYARALLKAESDRDAKVSQLRQLIVGRTGNAETLDTFFNGASETRRLRERIVKEVRAGRNDVATAIFDHYSALYSINSARLMDLSSFVNNQLRNAENRLWHLLKNIILATAALFVTILGTMVWVSRFYKQRIIQPLNELRKGLAALTKGNLAYEIGPLSASNEIEQMVTDFNTMGKALVSKERALETAREEALQASRAKSEFLSNMSHEIRTPMNVIVGLSNLIAEIELPPEHKEKVTILNKSSHLLLNVVNDILDYSKLESGHISIHEEAVNLRAAVDRVVSVIQTLAVEKNLELKVDIDAELPKLVLSDGKRLEQILLNLLGNAVKFTEHGLVSLVVSKKGERMEIMVADTGIGIPREKLPLLFNRFVQADSSATRTYGGTGLGLAIVKQVVRLMGGEVAVSSEEGQGSVFKVNVPLRPVTFEIHAVSGTGEPHERPKPSGTAARKSTLLLADDSPDNRFLVRSYLKNQNVEIEEAETGAEALHKFCAKNFDIVLMDIQMPEMDGYEATAKIREFERNNRRVSIPILALTAHAKQEMLSSSGKAGFNAYLTKPISKADLLQAVKAALSP